MSLAPRYQASTGLTTAYLVAPTGVALSVFLVLLLTDAPGHSLLWAPLATLVGLILLQTWLAKRRLLECQAMIQILFTEGDVEFVVELFEDRVRHRAWLTHGHFLFNRGVAFIFEGEHRKALAIFEEMRKTGAFTQALTKTLAPIEPAYRSYAAALAGELEEAESAIGAVDDESYEPLTILPAAIVALRSGDAPRALEILSKRWADIHDRAGVHTLIALHLVRAMATSIVEPERTNEVERLLSNLYPWHDEWIDWVGVDWPEMRAFCEENLDPAQKDGASVSD